MIISLSQATTTYGSAAAAAAQFPIEAKPIRGFVLSPEAMSIVLNERQEQIENLVRVRTTENIDRVAADLKRTVLTVHVPKEVEQALETAYNDLDQPVMMWLSPIGAVKDPLAPALVIGVNDQKAMLDGLRMLYAEMYSAENLTTEDEDRSAAIVIQSLPHARSTYRIIPAGEHTIVEASEGYSSWVGYGEPDRFLYQGNTLVRQERGTPEGVDIEEGNVVETKRGFISENEAAEVLAFVKPFLRNQPVLIARTAEGFVAVAALPKMPLESAE